MSPEWKTSVSLPRAEVHDPRGGNGGVSFRVPLTEFDDYRETITPLFGASMASDAGVDGYPRRVRWERGGPMIPGEVLAAPAGAP